MQGAIGVNVKKYTKSAAECPAAESSCKPQGVWYHERRENPAAGGREQRRTTMIVYFSGTGNSRYCAGLLADRLGDTCVDAFGYIRAGAAAELASDRPWVFVTPTYAWRLPRVFADFLRSGRFSGSREAYFVMTCGEDIGSAPEKNRALCAALGLNCRGTLPVIMPENYIAMFTAPDQETSERIIADAAPTLERAAECIRAGQDFPVSGPGVLDRLKSGIVNWGFYRFNVRAKPFSVSDACIRCGKCEAVCPLGNIRLVDGKPVWGNRCTHCMACICGCPTAAIEYGKVSRGKPRYQCPKDPFGH